VPPFSLHVETHGTGDPILLVHGFGANIYSWRHLVGPLARHHQVLAVDLKGFGASPKPADAAYSVHDQARLLGDLIVARRLTGATVVGHSLGGGVALATALALARGTPDAIRRLVLIDTIAFDQTLPWFIRVLRTRGLGELAIALVPPALQVRLVLGYAFHDRRLITDDVVAAYAAPMRDPAARRALVATARQLIPPDMEAFTRQYPRIDVPVLLLWGRQDRVVPVALGHRLCAALPHAELRVLEGCGHVPHEEEPAATLDAIERFLAVPDHTS
jgi:pimeloyl-ACP methyl ester carboxylesterase